MVYLAYSLLWYASLIILVTCLVLVLSIGSTLSKSCHDKYRIPRLSCESNVSDVMRLSFKAGNCDQFNRLVTGKRVTLTFVLKDPLRLDFILSKSALIARRK